MDGFDWFVGLLETDGMLLRGWHASYPPQPRSKAMHAMKAAVAQNGIALAYALSYLTPSNVAHYIIGTTPTGADLASLRVAVAAAASPPTAAQLLAACQDTATNAKLVALSLVQVELRTFRKAAIAALSPLVVATPQLITEAHVELPSVDEVTARAACGGSTAEAQAVVDRMWPYIMVGVHDPATADLRRVVQLCGACGVPPKLVRPFYYKLVNATTHHE